MTRLDFAMEQIVFARNYTIRLLDRVSEGDWFRRPAGGVTHIAWQVGHMAMAQYLLCLDRIRGVRPEDEELISPHFLSLFRRESVPDADATKYPSTSEIRSVFDRVHKRLLQELPHIPEQDLDQPLLKPHTLAKTKFTVLLWCAEHELVHAGQIGLVRRLLGYPPVW
jgi:uncharacterized damage-inducible protein DinB